MDIFPDDKPNINSPKMKKQYQFSQIQTLTLFKVAFLKNSGAVMVFLQMTSPTLVLQKN